MGFVSSLVGGIMGSNAADEAASVEAQAARDAQANSKSNQDATNAYQDKILANTQAAAKPYESLGSTSANHLASLLKTGFKAPTLTEAEATPGFQFRLNTGTQAIDQNAAANGTLMTGNTGKALQDYGQHLAESEYDDDFSRAMSTYMGNYQSLLGATGVGLTSTGQVAEAGQAAANNRAGVNIRSSEDQQQQLLNAAAARASGYLGTAKAWSGAAGGMAKGILGGIGNLDTTGGSSPWEQITNFGIGMAG